MDLTLNESARDVLDGPHFAVLATSNADGRPQSSVIFVKRDGDAVVFSTIKGRRKTRNMARDPRVSLLVVDKAKGRYVEIGHVEHGDPERTQHVVLVAVIGRSGRLSVRRDGHHSPITGQPKHSAREIGQAGGAPGATGIARIVVFGDPGLVTLFGLPLVP